MAKRRSDNSVRIIAGQWRSRRLRVADLEGLRPTGDRVRETLFNWLSPHLPGARVLDAFSGSGALGFEALSRAAAHATLIDNQAQCVATLEDNVRVLGANATVIRADVRRWLRDSAVSAPFDVVFVDPPFADDDIADLCTLLVDKGWLAPGAHVYVEQPMTAETHMPPALRLLKSRTAGAVTFALYLLVNEDETDE
ncbi:MAG: 16S rRNA (guanine(966)-N(2))-methyltransferase RsmD [Pseudomonadota bacterium]